LTIPIKLPFRELNDYYSDRTFVVPKGSWIGFYDDSEGGGSLFDCMIARDFSIELKGNIREDCPYWYMFVDDRCGYSMSSCYGADFWDGF